MFKQYTIQILWIFAFYLLGIGVSFLTGGIIPGGVMGMILLFIALSIGWVKPSQVEGFSRFLIRYMILFFIPPAIGIMLAWERVRDYITPVVVAMVVSTILVMVAVGWTQQLMERRKNK